jgi:predicted metal-dependent hydrolase
MIPYRLIRSDRKTISLELSRDGEVIVRAPRRVPERQIDRFVADKSAWLQKHLAKRAAQPIVQPFTSEEIDTFTRQAREILPPLVACYAKTIGVTYNRITVRHQLTRWGSCSSQGNLNFNCLLMCVPPAVRDYVIVHELCHRREWNHSARFWLEVSRVMPDYRQHEQWLKTNGGTLIRRLLNSSD